MRRPRLCFVGASNLDLISYAPRLPKLGETVPGTRFQMGFGGKGANQAVMAAKLGAAVTIVTRLGDDLFGRDIRQNFAHQGIDTTYVYTDEEAHTGVAPIWVEESSGNNAIIVALGANERLSPENIESAHAALTQAQAVICQWEIRTETALAALRIARGAGVTTIFNPAPAREDLPEKLYEVTDIFCPNESETELLTGMPVDSLEQAEAAARALLARGPKHVILTLGARGSLLVNDDEVVHVAAPQVQAVDTTGAGDAFVGSLAHFYAAGQPLTEAMAMANDIAARSVTAAGAQGSFPNEGDLPEAMVDFE